MKIKSKTFFASIGVLSITPIVASCSHPKILDFDSVKNQFMDLLNRGNIVPYLEFKDSRTKMKINDLDKENNYLIKWSASNFDDEDNSKITKKEIESVINKFNIRFSHYFIPRLNKDSESYVFFDLKWKNDNIKENFYLRLSNLLNNNSLLVNKNLNKNDLKELVEQKIINSNPSFVNDLNFLVKRYTRENNINIENNPIVDDNLSDLLKKQFSKSIKEFNAGPNYIDYLNINFDQKETKKPRFIINYDKVELQLFINSSEDNDSYYNFVLPLGDVDSLLPLLGEIN